MGTQPASKITRSGETGEGTVGWLTQVSGIVRLARWVFVAFAAVFAVSVVVQIFLAGMAIFVHPLNWGRHTSFVHVFELFPILMLIAAVIGKLPGRQRWQSVGLFGLIYIQYFTANFRAIAPWVAATHPVIAIGIVWLAFVVLAGAWKVTVNWRTK